MRYYTLLTLLLATSWMCGAIRSVDDASLIAAEQFSKLSATKVGMRKMVPTTLQLAGTRMKTNKAEAAFYVFNLSDYSGFAVVSADDRTEDVLCYSDEGSIDLEHLNPHLAWWLDRYQQQISSVTDETAYTPTEKAARRAMQYTAVSPLLGSRNWDQLKPYNNLCPIDPYDSTRSYTGCVATATAMIMAKWKYPQKGKGSKTYTCIFYDPDSYNERTGLYSKEVGRKELTVDFSQTTYDWDNMKDNYNTRYTKAQADAVATLMYHCGVAAEMYYAGDAAGGSGTYTDLMAVGLAEYFDYKYDKFITMYSYWDYGLAYTPDSVTEYGVERSKFESYFHKDIDAGRPILMGGEGDDGGHEFVCDGRDASGNFHINWGWSGSGNCYCTLSALNLSYDHYTTYGFSDNLDALIGLRPATDIQTGSPEVKDCSSQTEKKLIDGRLYLHRGEQWYDATGHKL